MDEATFSSLIINVISFETIKEQQQQELLAGNWIAHIMKTAMLS